MAAQWQYLATAPRDKAHIVASRLRECFPQAQLVPEPSGYWGLVWLGSDRELPTATMRAIPELEQAIAIEAEVAPPDCAAIAATCARAAERLPEGATFAVRATRRGQHAFTSRDVKIAAGAAVLDASRTLSVDLSAPDFVIRVELVGDWAGIGLLEGSCVRPKKRGKADSRQLTQKLTLVQLAYESEDLRGTRRMGESLGRSVQAFELAQLIVVVDSPVSARSLRTLLDGIEEGRESRFSLQKRTYGHRVRQVPLVVYELYQLLRDAAEAPTLTVATDPRGQTLPAVAQELAGELESAPAVYALNGSNEGIPPGCFELADYTLDLAPQMTYGTDQAIAATTIALLDVWHGHPARASRS
ncbi:MAG: hypothetical protein BRC58_04385 [Cyanobacteria bacterium QS_8_64_29]|nr:MAG: hypothetical protein BRC58_04385 [Cyanobacteria bacterium QS_8_64_29]